MSEHAWRDTMSAHADALTQASLDGLEATVEQRIGEVRELARTVDQRIDWRSRADLEHALANLNEAALHLDDITGC